MLRSGSIIRISLLILLLGVSPALYSPWGYAQNAGGNWWGKTWRRLTGRPGENERTNSAGRGGANRDRCPYTTEELVAIVPVSAKSGIPYLEKTVAGYPIWWFYVPYASNGRMQAEFVLLDSAEQIVYENTSLVVETPGLVEVNLARATAPLSIGENYRWVFSIICNPANRSGDATVNGWIQRTVPQEETDRQPHLGSRPESYVAAAKSAHWFDLLAEVNRLRSKNPKVFNPVWQYLLCQVYAQEPKIESLTQKCDQVDELYLPQPDEN